MAEKLTIIIVEDSQEFRKSLRWILEPKGYSVIEAEDGLQAKDIITQFNPQLIISDLKMPKLDGLQLHRWLKESAKNIPFIIMTGHGELTNTQMAIEQGMQGFIPKPFSQEDVLESVNLALKSTTTQSTEPIEHQKYCKIPIHHFLLERGFPFNIYICTPRNRFIKVAHRGEDLEPERVKGFQKVGVQDLFILKKDYLTYLGFNLSLAKSAEKSDKISKEKKQAFISDLGESILTYVLHDKLDEASFSLSKAYIETAASIAVESDELFEVFSSLRSHSDFLYAHSLSVSIYSVLIAKELGWNAPSTYFKLALGGLFHDIGKKELEEDLIRKPVSVLSHMEKQRLESHVVRGVEILSGISGVPGEILQIVHHHHETRSGNGYPKGKKGDEIFPLAKVISVADDFCNLIINGNNSGYTPKEALSKMIWIENQYDREIFLGLLKLFNENYEELKKKAS